MPAKEGEVQKLLCVIPKCHKLASEPTVPAVVGDPHAAPSLRVATGAHRTHPVAELHILAALARGGLTPRQAAHKVLTPCSRFGK